MRRPARQATLQVPGATGAVTAQTYAEEHRGPETALARFFTTELTAAEAPGRSEPTTR